MKTKTASLHSHFPTFHGFDFGGGLFTINCKSKGAKILQTQAKIKVIWINVVTRRFSLTQKNIRIENPQTDELS